MGNYTETKEKYNKLADFQKDLLKMLVLIDVPSTKTKIMQASSLARVKDRTDRVYNSLSIGHELEELKNLWLVKKDISQQYQIYPDAFDFILREAIADKRLNLMRSAALEVFPGIGTSRSYYVQLECVVRDLCFSVYMNDYEAFDKAKEYILSRSTSSQSEINKLCFVDRFGVDNISTLAPRFQFLYYRTNLDAMLFGLENIQAPLKTIQSISADLSNLDKNFINQCVSYNALFQGDWNTVLKIWNGKDNLDAWKFIGTLHFLQGQNNKALTYYETALKALRKEEKSTKSFFIDYHGVFYILALIKEDNIKHLPTIKKYLKEVFSYGLRNNFLIISTIVESLQNNKERAEELFGQEFIYYNLDGLFYLYAQYWTQTFAPNWEKYAHTLHHKALKNGCYWVAYNVAILMQNIATDKIEIYQKSVLELQPKIDHAPSLLDVVPIREDWEIALQTLELFNNNSTKVTANQTTRLIWLIDFSDLDIQPKVQKLNQNGSWSKGRNVALSKLVYGEVEEVTPQDNRVASTISRDYGWYGNNGSYSFLSLDRTFKELIGHPLLFLTKSPDVACQLQKGSPELIIKEIATGYEISSSIDISKTGFLIKKETPTRYQYIEITPEQVQLYQALGNKKLVIPKKGKEKLEKALPHLASIITLQSDLEYQDENMPSMLADNRIYVHLLPVGDGFHIELFVKPFQVCPPYYNPGEGASRAIAMVEGIRSKAQRDLVEEKKAQKELIANCPTLRDTKAQKGVWQLDTPIECLELLRDLEPFKLNNNIVIEWPKGEKIKVKQYIGFDNLQLSIKKENDWFGISGKVHVNENLVLDMRQLLNMLQEQKSEFIVLDDGQFLALSKQLKKQLNNILKFSDDNGRVHPLAGFALGGLADDIQNMEIDEAWNQHIEKLRLIEKKTYKTPKNLKATLRGYQQEGFQWLSKLADWGVGACLADDMGLGKTIQALALMLQRSKQGPSLVVAPASVCRNWIKEIEKFTPDLTSILFSDMVDRVETLKNAQPGQVLISTYGLLQSESELFSKQQFATIVLDEAQAIKNNSAKRSKAAMQLNGGFKIITTGTPIENHLSELWNLFRFINPGLLGSMDSFRNRFAVPIERDRDSETQAQLQLLIRPFILRRHKKDVLKELPEKTEIVLSVNLSEEELAFYEVLRQEAIQNIETDDQDKTGAKHLKVLAQIMRLRQACCNPKLVNPKAVIKSSKLKLFGTIVEELIENGHKALVFSQFVGHLKLIEEYVVKKGISYQYLDGQTPTKTRQERIDAFQDGQGDLFLISLKAGGTGLNLTAADYVIHMDPWWNPAVEDQASDRAHRIGQQRPVTVYRLITENTIEEKIIKLHESKRDLADSLLEGTDASSKLTASDLLELIKNQ